MREANLKNELEMVKRDAVVLADKKATLETEQSQARAMLKASP